MTQEEKMQLEAAKAALKAGIAMRTDMTESQKRAAMQQVDDAGYRTEAITHLCRLFGINI